MRTMLELSPSELTLLLRASLMAVLNECARAHVRRPGDDERKPPAVAVVFMDTEPPSVAATASPDDVLAGLRRALADAMKGGTNEPE